MNEHHLGAVFKDQVGDSAVGHGDAHQVLTLQGQHLKELREQLFVTSAILVLLLSFVVDTKLTEQ